MKPFEERYTAWIEGELTGEELVRFEEELSQQHPDAEEDRRSAQKLGHLLREFGGAPPLTNPDFFNHQLLARIEAEQAPARVPGKDESRIGWSISRWAWLGAAACAVGMAFVLSETLLPTRTNAPTIASVSPSPYMVQVLEAQAADSDLWVTAVHSDVDDVTVLWIDGLDYLPASYQLN